MVSLTKLTSKKTDNNVDEFDVDKNHITTVLWQDPKTPNRTKASIFGGRSPLPWLIRGIKKLIQAGAKGIVIPCNTVHLWYPQMNKLAKSFDVPIFHIVDSVKSKLANIGINEGSIGLIATSATVKLKLYHKKMKDYKLILPSKEQQKEVVKGIYLVKKGKIKDAYPIFANIANDLASKGAKAVILGCTEVPIGIKGGSHIKLNVPVIDSIESLAEVAVKWGLDQ